MGKDAACNASISYGCTTCDPAPCYHAWETSGREPDYLGHYAQAGDLDECPGCCLHYGSGSARVAVWTMNQLIEYLSLSELIHLRKMALGKPMSYYWSVWIPVQLLANVYPGRQQMMSPSIWVPDSN